MGGLCLGAKPFVLKKFNKSVPVMIRPDSRCSNPSSAKKLDISMSLSFDREDAEDDAGSIGAKKPMI
jgi:hypothetical protein